MPGQTDLLSQGVMFIHPIVLMNLGKSLDREI